MVIMTFICTMSTYFDGHPSVSFILSKNEKLWSAEYFTIYLLTYEHSVISFVCDKKKNLAL